VRSQSIERGTEPSQCTLSLLSGRTHREALVAFLVARLAQRRQSMSIRLPRTWWVILAVELALIVILIRLLVAVTTAFWGWP
jgi:hypothetical protein